MASHADRRNTLSLDSLNFFLADVRDGLGPYLAIYLLAVHKWDPASIGVVMTIAGIAGLLTQTPAGALIDRTPYKRAMIGVAALLVTLSCLILPFTSSFTLVALTQALSSVAASVFAPAIAAISLGITGPKAFTRRTGRNETFNHAGNACAALLAGGFAYLFGPIAVFYLMAAMALASVVAISFVSADAIDHDVARGFDASHDSSGHQPSGFAALLSNKPLLMFGICCALFHLANAAMLPLVSQKLSQINMQMATPLTSACIVAAQLVMVPAALLVGMKADVWGRKPLLLAGCLFLPIRGVLYTLSDDPYWLVAVQMLDGIGAGLFGALFPLMVKDLTQGSGRFNVSLGALSTMFGLGAALSNSLAGFVVHAAGYSAAFLTLAGVAAAAFVLLWVAVPETLSRSNPAPDPKPEQALST
ncbi:MFS transporter [Pseudomonas cannabina]|uniref:MFS transporter n=3 Tax=Pseudomonas syringae group TaxID=136849 RepID=A0A8T8BZT8_PSEYM|nr:MULTISPECIES: MFS transporter [Pseudomonas syringae group]KPB72345.1 Major facilitator transporter [Pseudomonas syringae pv. maculicola]KPW24024.1 Major facilitator transporter [Pseudomonas cannabina pv. alisalensis]MBM0140308.1 MFS transporter [Pseudomonas cannabina pv. alisalensis]QHE96930.1 MFS transporter [Pseudomonas syringae pv. maculicola str. ES4326]QQN20021.1 MFS transporter [Pseudomonas cannabina pv. alisalensis]